ncbi:MAG TPA: hypothetical protein VFR07_07015 [Mycobacteriales bacterium]|jgi:hypothetical protein|nr:hypothetical protein [Mycobacteriales bacterium]
MTTPRDNADATVTQEGVSVHGDHVPTPPGGVRGVDQVDNMDSEPGHGTTTGADGETAAREQLRRSLGERGADTGSEEGGGLEQAAALGATDDPQGGSIQPDGAAGA